MVDDVKDITETAESKAQADAIDRARLARERREAEQRKRLDELRAHAAAAQAQREKRDEERRRRQAEQRAKDDDRRQQVEERKRAIWEASISRREALLQREKDRTERLERARLARSAPRPAFAFGSSTPRLLEPLDSAGFFWAARSTNPIDQMNFFESLAASTTNVMFASAPLTRRASALQLDSSDTDNKDEPDRTPPPVMWSSVARRRTDLVPTIPAPRAPECRSGETTPSRPGSALSQATTVTRRTPAPRRPRPASIAGTGVNTPRGGVLDVGGASAATTPSVSRDSSVVGATVPRRPAASRRPRPLSLHRATEPQLTVAPGEGKPPVHRKPKSSKEHDKSARGKSASPGRALSPTFKDSSIERDLADKESQLSDKSQVSAVEVTQKLEALQIHNGDSHAYLDDKVNENKENILINLETNPEQNIIAEVRNIEVHKPVDDKRDVTPVKKDEVKPVKKEEVKPAKVEEVKPAKTEEVKPDRKEESKPEKEVRKEEEKKDVAQEKTDDSEMTASMTARRITTEEEAKAALAERRRKAREELERQAELERQRLQREAEEEAERQRQEEERQRREEEEARELAALQRQMQEEKLRKAIEAQQQLEREESERRAKEEAEKRARQKEEEEKRRAAEEAERLRKEEAEREEKERLLRKQRVEAIMARTRLKKQAEEEKKQQEKSASPAPAPATTDNGNPPPLITLAPTNYVYPQAEEQKASEPLLVDLEPASKPDNGNAAPAPTLMHQSEETAAPSLEAATNGNHVADFSALNGHAHTHPLTLHNAL
ncbi:unnamed protein product [Chilo suppressalis]|uniref:MAP7 domain-containing protein n=1 Tax=Chilo suppressalis TaxID=168631 RepID=A0ABN8L745_CHISP|nr:unnamed protein product [Chilo suppressalis]